MGAPITTPNVPANITKTPRPITRSAAPTSTSSSIIVRNMGSITWPMPP